MGRVTVFIACGAVALLTAVAGCTSTGGVGPVDAAAKVATVGADAQNDAGEDASACIAAGGFCSSGDVSCTNVGPQACGSAGGFCCLPSAGPINGRIDGECNEAGGQCLIGLSICAVPGAQSCGGWTPAGFFCCLSNVADCGQPDATTYECPDAQPAGGSSCKSAPIPVGAPNYEALMAAEDNDASYPAGCKATFPACNGGQVPYCTCSGSAPGTSGWNCVY